MQPSPDSTPVTYRQRPLLAFSDDVDWSRAIPPHLAQRQRPPSPPQQHRTLVFDWPLPEGHPSLAPRAPRQRQDRSTQAMTNVSQNSVGTSRRQLLAEREQDTFAHWSGVTRAQPQPRRARQHVDETNREARSAAPVAISQPSSAPVSRRTGDARWELEDFSYESLLELGSLAVSTGLDKKQLMRFSATPFDSPEACDCAVCLESVFPGNPCISLPCRHSFHSECIIKWLSRSNRCPNCRFEIPRRDF